MKQKVIFNNPSNVLQYAANRYGDYIAPFRGSIDPYKVLKDIMTYQNTINEYFTQSPKSNISATVYYNKDDAITINNNVILIGSFLMSDVINVPIEKVVRYELNGEEKILPLILLNSKENDVITKMLIDI